MLESEGQWNQCISPGAQWPGEQLQNKIEDGLKKIRERLCAATWIQREMMLADGAVIFHGLNDAIVGIDQNQLLIYDYQDIVKIFMDQDGMTEEEAREFADYNVIGINGGRGFTIIYDNRYRMQMSAKTYAAEFLDLNDFTAD